MAEIVQATDEDVARFYRGVTFNADWIGKVVRKGRLVAAFGGALEVEPGTWLAFLDVPAHIRRPSLYRHTVRGMAEAKARGARVIKAACDADIPRSEALLARLGFQPTDEELDGRKVWEWRVSSQQ